MIKAVIFDCDGTLVDSEKAHYAAWHYAFRKQHFELSVNLYMTFVGKGHLVVAEKAYEYTGRDCKDELLTDKNNYYSALVLKGIPPIHSTVQFLHTLYKEKEQHGLKLAVASGANRKEILQNLRNLEVEHYFDFVLSAVNDLEEYQDPEGINKPKPYVYLKAAKMLNLLPEECLAIEDSASGIASAKNAGCLAIAIPNNYTEQHDFRNADLKLHSLEGFSIEKLILNYVK